MVTCGEREGVKPRVAEVAAPAREHLAPRPWQLWRAGAVGGHVGAGSHTTALAGGAVRDANNPPAVRWTLRTSGKEPAHRSATVPDSPIGFPAFLAEASTTPYGPPDVACQVAS